ncbi:MAG: AraC family transcriptional regulator [Candidatus Acidiferrales bacterium]
MTRSFASLSAQRGFAQAVASRPRALPLGVFFGEPRIRLRTTSFVFSSLLGTCPEEEVPRHSHPEAHFVLVLRGAYITEAREAESLCGPLTLIFNPAGTTHRDRFRSRDGQFLAMSLRAGTEEALQREYPYSVVLRDQRVIRTAREACLEMHLADDISGLVLEGLGLELLGRALRAHAMRDRNPPRWLCRAREQLREGCALRISIAEVARTAGVHSVHFARAFRRYFHCSPGEYVRGCRVERACQLLIAARLPLAEVAQEPGFADQSQMSHAVKRLTGNTPRELRRAFQS